jgi:putative transposase
MLQLTQIYGVDSVRCRFTLFRMHDDIRTSPVILVAGIQKLFSKDLAMENDFLRAENRVLRELLPHKRPKLNDKHRRMLVKYGMRIKNRLADVVSIVKPETILAWNRRMKAKKWDFSGLKNAKQGRPPKGQNTESLVVKLAEDNSWGYLRIAGELKKLGHKVSESYVRDMLRKHGFRTSPYRRHLSWKTFIQAHMDASWATDFFTEEVWTGAGLVTFYVLFFIHLKTRRISIAGCTPNPNACWMQQQARNLCMNFNDPLAIAGQAWHVSKPRYFIHDRDSSFLPFDFILESEDIEVIKTPPRTPKCNAFAERFVREARETLDDLILLGEGHLRHALKCIEQHHNQHRPHQGIENNIPLGYNYPDASAPPTEINCESTLGGLLRHYHVGKAA